MPIRGVLRVPGKIPEALYENAHSLKESTSVNYCEVVLVLGFMRVEAKSYRAQSTLIRTQIE